MALRGDATDNRLRYAFKEDIEGFDSVYPYFRKDMGLCGRCEEEQRLSVRDDVFLNIFREN